MRLVSAVKRDKMVVRYSVQICNTVGRISRFFARFASQVSLGRRQSPYAATIVDNIWH
jgi:hypothetical protein